MNLLKPKEKVKTYKDIDFDKLKSMGIKLLIFDIDNTLVPYYRKLHAEVFAWLEDIRNKGFEIAIMTNNTKKRIIDINGIFCISNSMKPMKKNYKKVLMHFGLRASETAAIGDQILTDILGANRMKIYSIMVDRIANYEKGFFTVGNKVDDFLRKIYD